MDKSKQIWINIKCTNCHRNQNSIGTFKRDENNKLTFTAFLPDYCQGCGAVYDYTNRDSLVRFNIEAPMYDVRKVKTPEHGFIGLNDEEQEKYYGPCQREALGILGVTYEELH